MKFWQEHKTLRALLMLVTLVAGLVLLVHGWGMTGKLAGLGLMLLGVALVLCTLWLYNQPFADPKPKKK